VNQGRKQFLTGASAEAVKYGDVVTEAKSSDMKSGVMGGLEFGMDLIEHVAVALRFGSLSGGSGTLKFSEGFSSDWGGGNVYSSYTDYESELSGLANAFTLGARWSYDLTPRLAIGAGLFGGLGFGSMDETASITMRNAGTGIFAAATSTPPLAWTQIWSGSGPVGEALVSARYRVSPHFILGLDAGYRYLVIAAMKAGGLVTLTEDSDGNGSQDFVVYQVNPGDPYRNLRYDLSGFDARFLPTGGPVPFNFSGLEATLTATVHF